MKKIKSVKFLTYLREDTTFSSRALNRGQKTTVNMTIYDLDKPIDDRRGRVYRFIEMTYKRDGQLDATQMGLWFKDNALNDYDGVFALPKEAIQLIRDCGFTVAKEFEV